MPWAALRELVLGNHCNQHWLWVLLLGHDLYSTSVCTWPRHLSGQAFYGITPTRSPKSTAANKTAHSLANNQDPGFLRKGVIIPEVLPRTVSRGREKAARGSLLPTFGHTRCLPQQCRLKDTRPRCRKQQSAPQQIRVVSVTGSITQRLG